MRCVTYKVEEEENDITVEKFLRKKGVSRRVIIDLKKEPDGITANNEHIRTIDRLKTGDNLTIRVRECDFIEHIIPQDIELDIIYQDEDMTVISKKAGIAVHPSPRNRENTVANALAFKTKKKEFVFRAIGRLDKNTSGLLVVAENPLSAAMLSDMSSKKLMRREYIAVCTGDLPESGIINAPIRRQAKSVVTRIVADDGERAVTHFKKIAYKNGFSLSHIWLETGRTHQIRVHMKHIGHPLPGDFLYNSDYNIISRHALHAAFLNITQPITGEKLEFFAPLPADMHRFFPEITSDELKILCGK